MEILFFYSSLNYRIFWLKTKWPRMSNDEFYQSGMSVIVIRVGRSITGFFIKITRYKSWNNESFFNIPIWICSHISQRHKMQFIKIYLFNVSFSTHLSYNLSNYFESKRKLYFIPSVTNWNFWLFTMDILWEKIFSSRIVTWKVHLSKKQIICIKHLKLQTLYF